MAELLGHEAALFLPTATMANQAALRAQTTARAASSSPRSGRTSSSTSGAARRSTPASSCAASPAERAASRPSSRAENDPDLGPGGIVVLENTHRSSGGTHLAARRVPRRRRRSARARRGGPSRRRAALQRGGRRGRRAERVGAACRLRDASASRRGSAARSAPSLAGSAELIERAWESKYLFGGAMRQSGVIAAAMLYALDHHVERLADDHARARAARRGRSALDAATVRRTSSRSTRCPGSSERRALKQRGVARQRPPAGLAARDHASRHRRRRHRRAIESSRALQEVLDVHA